MNVTIDISTAINEKAGVGRLLSSIMPEAHKEYGR